MNALRYVLTLVLLLLATRVAAQSVTEVVPSSAPIGARVIVVGSGLEDVSVLFSGREAPVFARSSSLLEVGVPWGTPTGTVEIRTLTGVVGSFPFTVTDGPAFHEVGTLLTPSASHAPLKAPRGIAIFPDGRVVVADTMHHQIVFIGVDGPASIIGTGKPGLADGPVSTAQFQSPAGVAIEGNRVLVADTGNHVIRAIDANGLVTTIAGTEKPGNDLGAPHSFHLPGGVAVDRDGSILIADTGNHVIKRLTSEGAALVAGNGKPGHIDGTDAMFHEPAGITITNDGTILVADGNHTVRAIKDGVTSTLAGVGQPGLLDGPGVTAQFHAPTGVAVAGGTLVIADRTNHLLRRVTQTGVTSTVAGSTPGLADGALLAAQFRFPSAVASEGMIVVADEGNDAVRVLYPEVSVSAVYPRTGAPSGGETVRVLGTGFAPGRTTVRFGSAQALVTYVSSTELLVTTPPGTGIVDVTVTTPAGTNVLAAAYQYGSVIVRIAASPASAIVDLGQSLQLKAFAIFQDNTVSLITNEASWTSSDPQIARVNTTGLVTAHTKGFATITAQYGGFTATSRIQSGRFDPPPPDPSIVAPPVDPTVATDFVESTAFLYNGNVIQKNARPTTWDKKRLTVVSGRVLDASGQGLVGTKVQVLGGESKFGYTITREDGQYDFVIEGGFTVTLAFTQDGFLPVHRKFVPTPLDFHPLEDIVMLELDSNATTIDLASLAGIAVARGSVSTDVDGTRQATLFFTPGTRATLTLPGQADQPLGTITVRATEYTVGSRGPQAMPAELPAPTAYTYCVEFSVDDAPIDAGVTFNQPVITYIENFLGFPNGGIVPSGWYDRATAEWVASDNGRVIKILSLTGTLASIDIDGDGNADDETTLAALGITTAERKHLASLYTEGQSLWRVPVTHFSPHDFNWSFAPPPDGAVAPNGTPTVDRRLDDPACAAGSVIECENRTLGETIPINGTPFALHYRSDRVKGRTAAYTVTVPLTDEVTPPALDRIDVRISVAGQLDERSFSPSQRSFSYTWDGRDAYGREVQGPRPVIVAIGYVYKGRYVAPQNLERAFGAYDGVPISGSRDRLEYTLWRAWHGTLGLFDGSSDQFGSWSLTPHHAWNPSTGDLMLGDGSRRTNDGPVVGKPICTSCRGIPTVGPDGAIYFVQERAIYKYTTGTPVRVVGNLATGCGADNVSATSIPVETRGAAVASNGVLYVTDRHRIRKVVGGVISTIAGACTSGGIQSKLVRTDDARFNYPRDLALGKDGSIWVNDGGNQALRRIRPDGYVETIRGGINFYSLVVSPDNEVYFWLDRDFAGSPFRRLRVVKLENNGNYTPYAGEDIGFPPAVDGARALETGLQADHAMFGSDGTYYFAEWASDRILKVQDGIVSVVAGNGTYQSPVPGVIATGSPLKNPHVIVRPDGSILALSDGSLYPISPVKAYATASETFIASPDASELYVFSPKGRHLRTINAATGTTILTFSYDSDGNLSSMTDADGRVTTIERDANGPTAIVGPFGHRTTLAIDGNGYLASVANEPGETWALTTSTSGLLQTFTNPRGKTYRFEYDVKGLLEKDTDPAGGYKELTAEEVEDVRAVRVATAVGRVREHVVKFLSSGRRERRTTDEAGFETITSVAADRGSTTTLPDGTVVTAVTSPDPRFGMESPYMKGLTLRTPSGLTSSMSIVRSATLSNPNNPLTLTVLGTSASLNGRTYTSTFTNGTKTLVTTTPEGRTASTIFDSLNRPLRSEIPGVVPVGYAWENGFLTRVTQGTRSMLMEYDERGNLSALSDPLSRTTTFEYDATDRLVRQVMSGNREILFSYDENGNLTSITPPGRSSHLFRYTSVDLGDTYEPPAVVDGGPTRYEYNQDRGLTRVLRPDGKALVFTYDEAGRLATLDAAGSLLTYGYDAGSGRLTSVTGPSGTVGYTFDGPLVTGTSWSGAVNGAITWQYDDDFRISSETVTGTASVSVQYDADSLPTSIGALSMTRDAQNGRLTGTSLGTVTDTLSYDSFGDISAYTAAAAGTQALAIVYTRADAGRITSKQETRYGVTFTESYEYDEEARLAKVYHNGDLVTSYTYDANGNRLTRTSSAGVETATYDGQDRLLTYDDATYTYTPNGELRSKTDESGTTTYSYDTLGNLRTVILPDGTTIEYVIDGQQRRVGKKVNGTLVRSWLYSGQLQIAAELDGSGAVVSRFVYASRSNVPDYMIRDGITYRIVSDHLGSPRYVLDVTNGNIMQSVDYDEFGNVAANSNPGFQPFGFAGGLYDRDTGLTRFGARDYDAGTGRWTAKDPIGFAGADTNLYGYVVNNPINWIDPTGHTPWGLIFAGADLALQLYNNDGRWDCVSWTSVGFNLIGGGVIGALGKGALRFKTVGSHSWNATRAWMNRRGIQMLKPGQQRHHWLFEQNQGIGRYRHEAIKNQPWNTNPISARFNNWLGRHSFLAPLGGPAWAGEVTAGAVAVATDEENDCACP